MPSKRSIYRYFRDNGEVSIAILYLSLADHLATRGPNLELKNWQEHCNTVCYALTKYQSLQESNQPDRLVDGHDLIRTLGVNPSPILGKILGEIEEAQAAGEIINREQALDYARYIIKREKGRENAN
jgi:poly(A) polymerase